MFGTELLKAANTKSTCVNTVAELSGVLTRHLPSEPLVPIATTDPAIPLSPAEGRALQQVIGRSKLVFLGEETHGSHEVQQLRDRITRHLIEHEGVRLVAIEANLAHVEEFNLKLQCGKGEATSGALAILGFWALQTAEMLDFVRWLQAYNLSKPPSERVALGGFDMKSFEGPSTQIIRLLTGVSQKACGWLSSLTSLLQKFPTDQELTETFDRYFDGDRNDQIDALEQLNTWGRTVAEDLDSANSLIESARRILRTKKPARLPLLERHIRLLSQMAGFCRSADKFNQRDSFLAENLVWLRRQNRNCPTVAWAHNIHVRRSSQSLTDSGRSHNLRPMAAVMRDAGIDLATIGFALYQGRFSCLVKGQQLEGDLHPDQSGSQATVEGKLHNIGRFSGVDKFLLNLDINRGEPKADSNPRQHLSMRMIASTPARSSADEFQPINLITAYNALLYIDKSSPSMILG